MSVKVPGSVFKLLKSRWWNSKTLGGIRSGSQNSGVNDELVPAGTPAIGRYSFRPNLITIQAPGYFASSRLIMLIIAYRARFPFKRSVATMIGCLPTQALAFLVVFVYATHATQAIAFEWKPGFTVKEELQLSLRMYM